MIFGPLAFLNPWLLLGLLTLPAIYWLLRAVPPRPARVSFPPTRILVGIENKKTSADKTPWWLTLIRLLAAALVILALAEPVLNPLRDAALKGDAPLVLFVDNGWSTAAHWQSRPPLLSHLISEAESSERSVIIVPTATPDNTKALKVELPADAHTSAAAIEPQPFQPERTKAIERLRNALQETQSGNPSIVWLHDGIDHGNGQEVINALNDISGSASFAIVDLSAGEQALGLVAKSGENGRLEAIVLRPSGGAASGTVHALSARGERLAELSFQLAANQTRKVVAFDLPLELRNQVARIQIVGERSAGSVSLIDAATQWHRVGLISGESQEQAQPLLAPLYYIRRALKPYAELAISKESNLVVALEQVVQQNVSSLMLADIGTITGRPAEQISKFVNRGGLLVRFAGPRLEKGGDDLLPVSLRARGRSLGGALSWSNPQPLAPFDEQSPFAGLSIPDDVKITRQVLADPGQLEGDVEIWARLADGTPLATASRRGEGRIVLFHVTANTDWSNLPMSGLFVEMLRRLSTMGQIGASAAAAEGTAEGEATAAAADTTVSEAPHMMPPLKTLDGYGALKSPPATAEPIKASLITNAVPSAKHPSGYYGSNSGPRAFNVLNNKSRLNALGIFPTRVQRLNYDNAVSTLLKPWMLALALLLLFIDIIAVIALQAGGLKALSRQSGKLGQSAALLLIAVLAGAFALTAHTNVASAQSFYGQQRPPADRPADLNQDEILALDSTGRVTFGYVLTDDQQTDSVSRLGLEGLSRSLETRTAVEPGDPVGVDITKDEIAFYPILYWPVLDNAQPLEDQVIAKIDAYMKEGGLIIFDTRDYGKGGANVISLGAPGGTALQRLLGKLDVPRLEPVPENHVVTKSFYLLRSFPGRWDGGQLWVEAIDEESMSRNRARVSDGVTSIMITSNDLASAWALDERNRPLYPVVPGGEMQREMAFRAGINIVMHALTGNYKADQVHVPALLERLGE